MLTDRFGELNHVSPDLKPPAFYHWDVIQSTVPIPNIKQINLPRQNCRKKFISSTTGGVGRIITVNITTIDMF